MNTLTIIFVLAIFCVCFCFIFYCAEKVGLFRKMYLPTIPEKFLLPWHKHIFLVRFFWFCITFLISEMINAFPVSFSAEIDNQLTILYYLAAYACTLLYAFFEDIHYWKEIVRKLDNTGENVHRSLVIDTLCTFCSTVLFSYLLMIQSSTGQVFSDYSPSSGSATSWKLNMIIAWFACSFVSIKLVLNHAFAVQKNELNKHTNKN